MSENTAVNGEIRVPFGPKDHQSVPFAWAQVMLEELYAQYPGTFARCLQAAAGVDPDAVTARRRRASA